MESIRDHSEQILESLLDQVSDAYFLVDAEGRIVDVNARACESLGYSRDELLQKSVWDVEATITKESYQGSHSREDVQLSGSHCRKNGSRFPVDVRISQRRIGDAWYCMVLARDVTDTARRAAEDAAVRKLRTQVWQMKEAHDLRDVLNSVISSLADLHVPFDQCGVNVLSSRGEASSSRSYNLTRSGEWAEFQTEETDLQAIWRDGKPSYRPDLASSDPLGERDVLEETFGSPVRSVLDVPFSHGTLAVSSSSPNAFTAWDVSLVERMAGVLSDGFRRWDDLSALHDEQERLEHIFNDVPIGMAVLDRKLRFQEVNPAFCDFLGYGQDDLCCLSFADVLHRDGRDDVQTSLKHVLETGGTRTHAENRYVARDGAIHWGSLTASSVSAADGDHHHCVVMVEDITERRVAEREMVHLERLRALGDMARGVAHNFNNILVGVLGYAQIIQMKSKDPAIKEDLQSIVDSALRAKALVQRLNRTVRDEGEGKLGPIDAAKVVNDVVEQARPRWKDDALARGIAIDVDVRIEETSPVRGTESRLNDIVSNLLFNAIDALPNGGRITVGVSRRAELGSDQGADDGVGMDERTRARLFDPFFTTKAEVGTGLGLSTVHATVRRWNGIITVDSAPDKGSTFTVRLPVWKDPEEASGTKRRVLVVEDEELVVRVLQGLLGDDFTLDWAENAESALSLYSDTKYDAAIVDLGLPDLSGDELARRFRELDGTVSTILITGWELEDADTRLTPFDFYLLKPFEEVSEVRFTLQKALKLREERQGSSSQDVA